MTHIDIVERKSRLPLKLAAGIAFSLFLAVGTCATAAHADEHGHGHGHGHHHGGYDRGYDGGYGGGYDGGYYDPPVIYGQPYEYPPPVYYQPGIVVQVPGIRIGVH